MNTLAKIKQYLDQNNVPYQVILHEEVYTAQELAQALHVPGKELVKVIILRADDRYCMAILPSLRKIDLSALHTIACSSSEHRHRTGAQGAVPRNRDRRHATLRASLLHGGVGGRYSHD